MPYQQFEKYLDSEVGSYNKQLLNLARSMLAQSPPLPPIITQKEEINVTTAKEHLANNYFSSVKDSLKNRWDQLEKGHVAFLEDVVRINDQLIEAHRKDEQTFVDCVVDRATKLKLAAKIHMMHDFKYELEQYSEELADEEEQKRPVKVFMQMCADSMGFQRPDMMVDRHSTLTYIKEELLRDDERRSSALRAEHDKLQGMRIQMTEENMLATIRMSNMKDTLEEKTSKVAQLELQLQELLSTASEASVSLFRGISAVQNIYEFLMRHRGCDVEETDSFAMLDAIQNKIIILEQIMKDAYIQKRPKTRKIKKRFVRRKKQRNILKKPSIDSILSGNSNKNCRLRSNSNLLVGEGLEENVTNPLPCLRRDTNNHKSVNSAPKRLKVRESPFKMNEQREDTFPEQCIGQTRDTALEMTDTVTRLQNPRLLKCMGLKKDEFDTEPLETQKPSNRLSKNINSNGLTANNLKQRASATCKEGNRNIQMTKTNSNLPRIGPGIKCQNEPNKQLHTTDTATARTRLGSSINKNHYTQTTKANTSLARKPENTSDDMQYNDLSRSKTDSGRMRLDNHNIMERQPKKRMATTKTNLTRLGNSLVNKPNSQTIRASYTRKDVLPSIQHGMVGSISAAVCKIVSMPIGNTPVHSALGPTATPCPAWASRLMKKH